MKNIKSLIKELYFTTFNGYPSDSQLNKFMDGLQDIDIGSIPVELLDVYELIIKKNFLMLVKCPRLHVDARIFFEDVCDFLGWEDEHSGEDEEVIMRNLGLKLDICHETYSKELGSCSSYRLVKIEKS